MEVVTNPLFMQSSMMAMAHSPSLKVSPWGMRLTTASLIRPGYGACAPSLIDVDGRARGATSANDGTNATYRQGGVKFQCHLEGWGEISVKFTEVSVLKFQ